MKRAHLLHGAILAMVLAVLVCSQGCTIKFKGKDIELESRSTVVYQFEGIELTDGPYR